MRMHRTFPILIAMVFVGLACRGDAADEGEVVARVDDFVLTVESVVRLLADEEQIPAQAEVIQEFAELWIDYTLLAAAATEDSTFSDLDLRVLFQADLEQAMLAQLRDSVIQVDTLIPEEDLRALYATESPDLRLRASHIMLTYPLGASAPQRDSVRAELEALRSRLVAGASFEALARQFSQDPGSASAGGDLGTFAMGEMVRPFEEALATLQPGEISGVVETPMGLHVIRLDERTAQDFELVAAPFRARVIAQRNAEAESVFVASLESEVGDLQILEEALQVTREMARHPETKVSRRGGRRALVEWDGGGVTVAELQEVLRREPAAFRQQVVAAPDEELRSFLQSLARRDLLLSRARESGLGPAETTVDSLVVEVAEQLRAEVRRAGLLGFDRAPGEPLGEAVPRAVEAALAKALTGAAPILTLGPLTYQLRERSSGVQDPEGVGRAILRIGERRASRGLSPLEESEGAAPGPVPPTAP